MTRDNIQKLLNSELLNEGEKQLVRWQYNLGMGSFSTHLWQAIAAADEDNLRKLWIAFPEEVMAYKQFTQTPLMTRKLEAIVAGKIPVMAQRLGDVVTLSCRAGVVEVMNYDPFPEQTGEQVSRVCEKHNCSIINYKDGKFILL